MAVDKDTTMLTRMSPGNTLDGSGQGHDNVNKNVTQVIP